MWVVPLSYLLGSCPPSCSAQNLNGAHVISSGARPRSLGPYLLMAPPIVTAVVTATHTLPPVAHHLGSHGGGAGRRGPKPLRTPLHSTTTHSATRAPVARPPASLASTPGPRWAWFPAKCSPQLVPSPCKPASVALGGFPSGCTGPSLLGQQDPCHLAQVWPHAVPREHWGAGGDAGGQGWG